MIAKSRLISGMKAANYLLGYQRGLGAPHQEVTAKVMNLIDLLDLIDRDTHVGNWLENEFGSLICSICHCEIMPTEIENGEFNYCPNCGSYNEEVLNVQSEHINK